MVPAAKPSKVHWSILRGRLNERRALQDALKVIEVHRLPLSVRAATKEEDENGVDLVFQGRYSSIPIGVQIKSSRIKRRTKKYKSRGIPVLILSPEHTDERRQKRMLDLIKHFWLV